VKLLLVESLVIRRIHGGNPVMLNPSCREVLLPIFENGLEMGDAQQILDA
jgi:hypothetical protein